jgi:hypothetical protein
MSRAALAAGQSTLFFDTAHGWAEEKKYVHFDQDEYQPGRKEQHIQSLN